MRKPMITALGCNFLLITSGFAQHLPDVSGCISQPFKQQHVDYNFQEI
ncbi:MAG TPA: hypothetical protein VGQ53_05900 [Chitinophagaceae bacterium]|jgi:hypothetical protein|nr:hypothetical protein [Chitinophagaceae bacterium]